MSSPSSRSVLVGIGFGQFAVAIGAVLWIYPPCGDTCNAGTGSLGFILILCGVCLVSLGLFGAARTWARNPSESEPDSERPWVGADGMDHTVSISGLPTLILGFLIFVAGVLILGSNAAFRKGTPPASVLNNATSLVTAGLAMALTGLLALTAGYVMDAWAGSIEEIQSKPLLLRSSQGSMWSVVSAMLQEEYAAAPKPDPRLAAPSRSPPQPSEQGSPQIPRAARVQMESTGKLYVGVVLIAAICGGLGIDLAVMLGRLL